jgi:hypothetical protein
VLTIRCTRKLLRRLGAEAITDPPSPTNLLGDWYANLIFVGHTPLVICVSERSLLPVLVEVKGASSFHPRFLEAARSVLQGIGAERDTVRQVREIGSFAIGMTSSRRVLGALNDLASLARFDIEANPSIDLVTLAVFGNRWPSRKPKRRYYPPISDHRAVGTGLQLIAIGTGVITAIGWSNLAPLQWLPANLIFVTALSS